MTDVISPSDVSYPADGFALFPDRSVVALRVVTQDRPTAIRRAIVNDNELEGHALLRQHAVHGRSQRPGVVVNAHYDRDRWIITHG